MNPAPKQGYTKQFRVMHESDSVTGSYHLVIANQVAPKESPRALQKRPFVMVEDIGASAEGLAASMHASSTGLNNRTRSRSVKPRDANKITAD